MTRATMAGVLLASVLLSSPALAESGHDSRVRIIEVRKDGDVNDIQVAVNRAFPGDTVIVWPGTYDDYKPRNGVTVKQQVEGTVRIVPRGSGRFYPPDDLSTPFERNVGRLADNAFNTDDQFWREVERGEANALRRLNDLVSGGHVIRQGNKIINRVTGQTTSTVGRTIGNAVDAVFTPIEDAVTSLGDAVVCGIGGGLIGALIGINICAAKQLSIQGRQLEELQKTNQRGVLDDGVVITDNMGSTNGVLIDQGIAGLNWQQMYPESYEGVDQQGQITWSKTELERQHEAGQISKLAAGQSMKSVASMPDRAAIVLQSADEAPGPTAAAQANVHATMMNVEVQSQALATQIAHNQVVEAHLDRQTAAERRAIEYRKRMRRGLPGYEGDGGLGLLLSGDE